MTICQARFELKNSQLNYEQLITQEEEGVELSSDGKLWGLDLQDANMTTMSCRLRVRLMWTPSPEEVEKRTEMQMTKDVKRRKGLLLDDLIGMRDKLLVAEKAS